MNRFTPPKNRPPTHPGEMLLEEFRKPVGISQVGFAERLGVSYVRLNAVINGRRGMMPDTALRLERATGMDADFWLDLQMRWDPGTHCTRPPRARSTRSDDCPLWRRSPGPQLTLADKRRCLNPVESGWV